MKYYHVDVFAPGPMHGNGLAVVFPEELMGDAVLLDITREFRQFETIFIFGRKPGNVFPARIFTMDEELEFAGHPVLGAGAVIHKVAFQDQKSLSITLDLSGRMVEVESEYIEGRYRVVMNQGKPEFIQTAAKEACTQIAEALNISESDLDGSYPVEVVSTGLPYLLVPVKKHLEDARIVRNHFESFLSCFGAKFVYLFNPETLECRTWDNCGKAEDAATGSAAGPLCAYLVKNRRKQKDEIITIYQGRFVNRPSIIEGWVSSNGEVRIRGDVSFFAMGEILGNE